MTKIVIPKNIEAFINIVISPFNIAKQGKSYSYLDYLSLPVNTRSNDEADVVDIHFTESSLEWLGFHKNEAQYKYNTTTLKAKTESKRPDFVALSTVGPAFVWEDKNTTHDFDEKCLDQLISYTAGTSGYAIWTNAKRLLGFRFDAKGLSQKLVEVDIENLVKNYYSPESNKDIKFKEQILALDLFYILFSRDRFTTFESLLNKICVDEETFIQQSIPISTDVERSQFISGARQVLDHLRLSAFQYIDEAQKQQKELPSRELSLRQEWINSKTNLLNSLSAALTPEKKGAIKNNIENIELRLGSLTENEISFEEILKFGQQKSLKLPNTDRSAFLVWAKTAKSINSALRKIRLESVETRSIVDAYQVWAEGQLIESLTSPEIFAEQVAYVIFIRLLLARILEDKGLLKKRIASDGGITAWRTIIERYLGTTSGIIHADSFLDLLNESLSRYYRHFFQQPVFDWFSPDDYFLVEALEFLSRYNFKSVKSDLLGFTYEEYIDRVARNRKGHFLTRPETVEYILSIAKYEGLNIIGRRFLDPSCGSGSFIVHALGHYRDSVIVAIKKKYSISEDDTNINNAGRLEIAQTMVSAAVDLFYGMDIDPFPCYLAELNILIQLLEDLHLLWENGLGNTIERFHIYITDSLALPDSVLNSTLEAIDNHDFPKSMAEDVVDDTFMIKAKSDDYASGFNYVIANPPYINRRQENIEEDYSSYPFFTETLSGDTNTYLLFLRLGIHYLAAGGTLCYIVPLTILGDASSKAIRKILTTHNFTPFALTRFYTGNVLFPGIDQATAIVAVTRETVNEIQISGGYTIADAETNKTLVANSEVLLSYNSGMTWQPWLVSPDSRAYHTQKQVKDLTGKLSQVIDAWFEVRQGDVNATHANPFRVGLSEKIGKVKGIV